MDLAILIRMEKEELAPLSFSPKKRLHIFLSLAHTDSLCLHLESFSLQILSSSENQ